MIAYLTVLMFRNNVTESALLSGRIILICLIVSLLTKLKYYNRFILSISGLFDFILTIYIYNPTESESISDYFRGVIEHGLVYTLFYIYLIVYYLIVFKKFEK